MNWYAVGRNSQLLQGFALCYGCLQKRLLVYTEKLNIIDQNNFFSI